jgi:hypothetical protein
VRGKFKCRKKVMRLMAGAQFSVIAPLPIFVNHYSFLPTRPVVKVQHFHRQQGRAYTYEISVEPSNNFDHLVVV